MNLPIHGVLAVAIALCSFSSAAAPTPDETYAPDNVWLCKPGRDDLCANPGTVTVVGADGKFAVQTLKPDADAPIDCFYIYPTISLDPNGNSSLVPGDGERRAAQQQFAPFASVCKPYAPMYRQITLAGLRSVLNKGSLKVDQDLGFDDVRAAWRYYLANDNKGRGVVLVGHSQGARMLMGLIAQDIEGKPAQTVVVSAVVPGFPILVSSGADVGGTFKSMPLCRSASQVGCIIAYSAFRESSPPPANARFGRSHTPSSDVACVDVMALSGQAVRAMLPVRMNLLGKPHEAEDWASFTKGMDSSFVELPGYVGVGCVKDGPNSYLATKLDASARGSRPADIPFDMVVQGKVWDDWGLHLIDLNVVMGNLLVVVQRQSAAWRAAQH